ncbi:MAG: PEP-utilizing enzyme [Patescibacteria group bacterium]
MKIRKKWYIIAREYVVSFFPTIQLADSLAFTVKRVLGTNCGEFAAKYQNHSIWWLATEKGWGRVHRAAVKLVQNDISWLTYVFNKILSESKGLVKWSRQFKKIKLQKISNIRLGRLYQSFVERNQRLYDWGIILPLLDFQDKAYFTKELTKLLKRKISAKQRADYFTTLTTSLRPWPDTLQRIGLLKLYKQLGFNKVLINNPDFIELAKKKSPRWYKSFVVHVKKFAALPYVYEGPAADENYYLDMLRDWARSRLNPAVALVKISKDRENLKNKQFKYLKSLKLSPQERKLVSLAREVTVIKPYRRLLQSEAYYYFEPVLVEIARRLNLSLRQVRYLLTSEAGTALRRGYADVEELNKRIQGCIYLNKGGRVKIILGNKKIADFWKQVKEEKAPRGLRQITGTTACPGQAGGKVCIVNTPEDMVHMQPGDILVSFATSPNLMPAIRQAAAIITDEGGLTSHAAIVSRELKIPCIIGTKIATKVLKNGNHVLVNATRGLIRIK